MFPKNFSWIVGGTIFCFLLFVHIGGGGYSRDTLGLAQKLERRSDGSSVLAIDHEETYRANRHDVTWLHGWPRTFLVRNTSFTPSHTDHDPADASRWALNRGVKDFYPYVFLLDLALIILISTSVGLILEILNDRWKEKQIIKENINVKLNGDAAL